MLTNLQLAGAPDGKNPAEIFPEANATGAMILLEVRFMSQHTGAWLKNKGTKAKASQIADFALGWSCQRQGSIIQNHCDVSTPVRVHHAQSKVRSIMESNKTPIP